MTDDRRGIDQPMGPAGKYRLRMSISGRQETIGFYDTLDEALRQRELHEVILKETAPDYEGETVEAYGRRILTIREVKKLVKDPESDWSRWNQHVRPDAISRVALKKLTSAHVSQWLRRLETKSLGVQTRRNCLNILRVVLREAVEDGKIKNNPAIGLRVKGKSKAADDFNYLKPDEVRRLLEAAPPGVERHIIAFAIWTGLRAGELCSLRLADVHVDDDEPRIVVRYGTPPDLPTKSGRIRTVPLFPAAIAVTASWLRMLPEFCPSNPHGLLFPAERGGFRDPAHVLPWRVWKGRPARPGGNGRRTLDSRPGLIASADLSPEFRWHDLRHTCASWLVSGWLGRRWQLQEVRDILGHTDIAVTQRYAHLAAGALAEAAAASSDLVMASQFRSHMLPAESASKSASSQDVSSQSHPRELNPRPTVYENDGFSQDSAPIRTIDYGLTINGSGVVTASLGAALSRALVAIHGSPRTVATMCAEMGASPSPTAEAAR